MLVILEGCLEQLIYYGVHMSLVKGYNYKKKDGYVKKCGLAIQVMKLAYIKGDVLPLAETLSQVFWGEGKCLF